jgi:hypothetical protein
MVEQFRKLGHDTPIEITSATGRTAYVDGETATVLDVEARLLDAAIPVPSLLLAIGKAVAGIRPVAARIYFVDRAAERWGIVWLGWSEHATWLNGIGEAVVASLRWRK